MAPTLRNQAGTGAGLPSALFLVTSDPVTSPRPAEAVRIAAGLAAWRKIKVHVYLHDAVVQGLTTASGQVRDEESFRQYLPILIEDNPEALLVSDRAKVQALETDRGPLPLCKTADRRLAELAVHCAWVMRF